MARAAQSALVNPFEPSSCAATLLGPKALMPAAIRSSTRPANSGIKPADQRACREFPGKRMLASARADEKHVDFAHPPLSLAIKARLPFHVTENRNPMPCLPIG